MMIGKTSLARLVAAARCAPGQVAYSTAHDASKAAAFLRKDKAAVSAAHERIVAKADRFNGSPVGDLESVEADIESTVAYLQDRFNMSKTLAIRTIALHPMLVAYNEKTMDAKLAWMEKKGIDRRSIVIAAKRHPNILGRSEEGLQARLDWFVELGVDPSKLGFIVSVAPQVMSLSLDTLHAKMALLSAIGLTDKGIVGVITRFPQAFTLAVENIQDKASWATAWGLTKEQLVRLITNVPEFLSLKTASVEEKLAVLDDMFGDGAAKRLWPKSFRVIMCNSDELLQSFQFLTTVVGIPAENIRLKMLMRRKDRLLQPRYEFLKQRTTADFRANSKWIVMSDSQFVDAFPDFEGYKAELAGR